MTFIWLYSENMGGQTLYEGYDPESAFESILVGTPWPWLHLFLGEGEQRKEWDLGNHNVLELREKARFVERVNYLIEMHDAFYGE